MNFSENNRKAKMSILSTKVTSKRYIKKHLTKYNNYIY